MEQLSFLDDPNKLVRKRDPDTSKSAALKAMNFKAGQESIIYSAICLCGENGATAKEIASATQDTSQPMNDVQVNRRLSSMGERKLIERRYEDEHVIQRGGCAVWWKR